MKPWVPRLKVIGSEDLGQLKLGIARFQRGEHQDAMAAFHAALELNPEMAEAHFMLGNAHLAQERYAEAITEYKQALQLKPEQPWIQYKLGAAYLAQKAYPEAIAAFQEALKLNPDMAAAHFMLGEIYMMRGRYAEAITEYKQALQLKPEQPWIQYKLGAAYLAQKAYPEAIAAFRAFSHLKKGASPKPHDPSEGEQGDLDWTTHPSDVVPENQIHETPSRSSSIDEPRLLPFLPALRSDFKIIPLSPRGKLKGFITQNPESRRVFEFGEQEYFLCQQLDGQTPLSEVQSRFEARFGIPVPMEQLEAFVNQLSLQGFVIHSTDSDAPASAPQASDRSPLKQWKIGNPDHLLSWLASRLGWCFTRTFFIGSSAIILLSLGTLLANWSNVLRETAQVFNLGGFLTFAIVGLFFVHIPSQLAKGLTCKHYGGHVRSFGLRLAFHLIPRFHLDVSDARLLRKKSSRLWTLSAGIYCQVLIWAMAILLWRITEGGISGHAFWLLLMIASTVGILVNLNPFARKDGYSLLATWLELSQLRERAVAAAKAWIFFRPAPEALTPREQLGFRFYGLSAILYSMTVTFLILSLAGPWLTEQFQGTGALILVGLTVIVLHRPIKQYLTQLHIARLLKEKVSLAGFPRIIKNVFKIGVWIGLVLLLFVPYPYDTGGPFRLLPVNRVEVRALVPGGIEQILVEEGQWVEKGQLLALQETREHQKNLETTQALLDEKRANLELMKSGPKPEEVKKAEQVVETAQVKLLYSSQEADRLKGLFEQKVISLEAYEDATRIRDVDKKELEEAQANLKLVKSGARPEEIEALEAEVRRLETDLKHYKETLELTKISSPTSGQITTPYLSEKVSQYLKEGDLLTMIEDARTIRAELEVPEADASEVALGAKVKVKTWAYPGTLFTGTVISVAPIALDKPEGKVVRVLTEIPNKDLLLKSEMTGYAKITAGWKPVGVVFTRLLVRFFLVEFWSWWP